LRGQALRPRRPITDTFEQGIVPQPIGIVAVGIPQSNLVEALPHLLTAVMFNFARIALIGQKRGQPLTQPEATIHLPQQQYTAITGNLRRIKGHRERHGRMEFQGEWCNTLCHRLAPLPTVQKL
jgi:hypothetical protein